MSISFIKNLARRALMKTETGKRLVLCYSMRDYLDRIGWLRSAEEVLPVDRDGNPIPWFTYPTIHFLSERVKSDMIVFEYGSGYSTLWWSRRVYRVVSYEHDPVWYEFLKGKLLSNVEYVYRPLEYGGGYSEGILQYKNLFDIVVIDGRDRVNCARNSLGALKEDGVIVWDNSDREKYEEGYSYLMKHGFKRLDFRGHGPVNRHGSSTSVFYRPHNCLDI